MPITFIERLKNKPNNKVIFLGKPNLLPEDFFNEIRKFEKELSTGGWTKRLDDETLLKWCRGWINSSKKQQEYCRENNIDFYDTSFNQMEIINNIVNEIKRRLSDKI